jgi:hypothetical protein
MVVASIQYVEVVFPVWIVRMAELISAWIVPLKESNWTTNLNTWLIIVSKQFGKS